MRKSTLHKIPSERLLKESIGAYSEANQFPYDRLKKVPLWKKLLNEKRLEKLINKLMNELEPYLPELKESSQSSINNKVKTILVEALEQIDNKRLLFDRPFLTYFLSQGYMDAAEAFIKRANEEESLLSNEEVFQALRNIWIMNSLQLLWRYPLTLTSPMYAYSMLYPYTDNLLDNPEISLNDKEAFNGRLKATLNGSNVEPFNDTEARIFELVNLIHTDYPLDTFPEVCESIRLIQQAQIDSMDQHSPLPLVREQLLRISFFKGGTSVLADAYLINGELSYDEMLFSFQYGAFLQLLDDLQDKQEDERESNQTLFSILKPGETADTEIRRLMSYIYSVNTPNHSDSADASLLKEVISQCTLVMIMEAVGKQPTIVSASFYKELESYSKVRLSFYKQLNDKIKEQFDSLK
ncbi:hypothetical protein [Alkalibacterium sp. MB6]|uniref:hypothetical protein n=1 Tax=Alkalibacterium sp. MB6 TaxID=2081965 RepID=UPI00137AE292|nr:hypothetical protein [Alkalibacterium sp. MB6]